MAAVGSRHGGNGSSGGPERLCRRAGGRVL